MRLIAHISDLHFGRHDPELAEALLSSLQEQNPDLIVVSGDLTQRARRPQFLEARRFLDRLSKPLLIVPGNHDIPLYNMVRRMAAPFRRYERHIASASPPESWYEDSEIAVLGLITVRRLKWKEGRISFQQAHRIQAKFAPLPPHVWRIVVTHHPIVSISGAASAKVVSGASLALTAMAKARVHLLLSGHHHYALSGEHAPEVMQGRSLLAVHAGTAISTRLRMGQLNSYHIIRLQGAHAEIRTLRSYGVRFHLAHSVSYHLQLPGLG